MPEIKKGQTILEYCVIMIIVVGALLTMQGYIKRGFQGRWRSAMDEMGDQYDPRLMNSAVRHTLQTSANSSVYMVDVTLGGVPGYYTMRNDSSVLIESKTGSTEVRLP